jgi:hypothetical protein
VADEWAVFDPELTAFNEWDTPQVQFSFQLRRKFEAHGWNGFLLIFIVGIMNFTAFGLDAGNTSERLALGVTTALTLISLGRIRRPRGFRGTLSPTHPDARVTG